MRRGLEAWTREYEVAPETGFRLGLGRVNHVHTATSIRIAAWSLSGSGPPQSYRIVVTAPAMDSVTKAWSKRNPDPDVERQLKDALFSGNRVR